MPMLSWLRNNKLQQRTQGINENTPRRITTNLKDYERKVHSQFAEDGIIERLTQDLGLETGTFFEIGISPPDGVTFELGLEGNCVLLREKGWKGFFLDGTNYPPEHGILREFVTAVNLNSIFRKYGIPLDLDVMSIDVDGQEFYLWMCLLARPKIFITEYNGNTGINDSVTINLKLDYNWDGTTFTGSSLLALKRLGEDKGYTLVFANGVNCFFVRDDLISNKEDFRYEDIYRPFPANAAPHTAHDGTREWVQIK